MSTQYGSANPQDDATNHWLLRIVAAIIDAIPWAIIVSIILWLFFWGGPLHLAGASWIVWGSWLLWPFFFGLFCVLYFAIMESSSGASLGKKVMGLKVQMLNGGKVPFGKAFTRNISKIYSPILLIDWIIGFATPGPDPHQRYFDRIAGTTVISVKQVFAPATPPPPPPPPRP